MHCKSCRKGDAIIEQRIACSVLIRQIYLTWAHDTRPFLRGQSAISRMAVRLAKTGYVEIRPDESDRRVKWVCLTGKGRQCGAYMVDLVAEAEEQLLRGLTPGEHLLLRELLEQVLENSVQCCLQKDGEEKV